VRPARLAFVSIAVTWLVLLATAPTAALGAPLSALTYAFGSLVCHQRPDRSFHLAAAQVPVCARCFGLYLGAAAGALAAFMHCAVVRRTPAVPTRTHLRLMLVASSVPTAVTWGLEALGLWQPTNVLRFAAALPLGIAVAVTVNYVECARPQRNGSRLPASPT
jgi:uncharacterized membrane protein